MLYAQDMRAPTPADLRLLIQGAQSQDPLIQVTAIRALGRLERRDVITDLLPYLRHAREQARGEAAHAIAQAMRGEPLPLDPRSEQLDGILDALLAAAATEREVEVLATIAKSLARLPYQRAAHIGRVEAMLRKIATFSKELSLQAKTKEAAFPAIAAAVDGLEMLARLNVKLARLSDETVDSLRGMSVGEGDDFGPRFGALRALIAARGLNADTLRPNLDYRGKGPASDIRRLAVVALSSAGSPILGDERFSALRQALRDPEFAVRYEAVRGYARTQAKTDGCQPLFEMLLDPIPHVAVAAIDAIGDACQGDPNAVNRLVGEVRMPPASGNNWQREAHALVALAKLSPPHTEIPMQSLSRHGNWFVRMYAARAAGILNDVEALEQLAADDHDNVREATLSPLKRLKGDVAEPQFVAALGRSDYQLLRTAALELNGMTPTKGLTAGLLDALQRVTKERKETSRDTRVALLERLSQFGEASHAEHITPLLRDFDPRVAAEAAATLQAWTGRSYETDPQILPREELPSAAELSIVTSQVARLEMESGIRVILKFDPFVAPLAAVRFLRLVNRNFYDGLTFHRVVPNFVIQGGSPGANEYVGDGPYMRDEISRLSHRRGTVGLSTRGRDTGDAQIFINLVDNPRLDYDYTIVGSVSCANGMTDVDRILEGDRIINITFYTPLPGRCR